MYTEIITFGDIEIEKQKFCSHKSHILIGHVLVLYWFWIGFVLASN